MSSLESCAVKQALYYHGIPSDHAYHLFFFELPLSLFSLKVKFYSFFLLGLWSNIFEMTFCLIYSALLTLATVCLWIMTCSFVYNFMNIIYFGTACCLCLGESTGACVRAHMRAIVLL